MDSEYRRQALDKMYIFLPIANKILLVFLIITFTTSVNLACRIRYGKVHNKELLEKMMVTWRTKGQEVYPGKTDRKVFTV